MCGKFATNVIELFYVDNDKKVALNMTPTFSFWKRLFVLTGMICLPVFVNAQTKAPKPPTKKEQEKNAAAIEKEAKKANEKAKKAYIKGQSKTTKKSMKTNKKRSTRNRNRKGSPFWERWFKRK